MVVIAFYFIVWALVHSILASITVKVWVTKLLGEGIQRWYRLFYVFFAVITLMPLLAIYYLESDVVVYEGPPPWRWLMMAGQVGAVLALIHTTWQSGLFQFIGLAQAVSNPRHFTGRLVTSGIFHYVRHPLYLSSILFLWLSPTMTQNQLVLYGLMTLYFIVGSIHEEQVLTHEFGESYLMYKQLVPRFIPITGRYYRDSGGEGPEV